VAGTASYGFDQYDSKDRKRATVDVNHVVDENLAFRLNAMIEDSGLAGRAVAEKKGWGFAPSVAARLGPNLRAVAAWEHVKQDDLPDWGVHGATVSKLAAYNPAADGAPRDGFYGLASD